MGTGAGCRLSLRIRFSFDHMHCYSKVNCLCLLPVEIFHKLPCQQEPSICTCVLLIHLAFLKIWAKTKSSIKVCGL